MSVYTGFIEKNTEGNRDIIDLTPEIEELLKKSGVTSGIVVICAPGSTAAITTVEFEPGLKKDIALFLEKILPYDDNYYHHETWHDDNGSSHVQAALIGPSVSIPIIDKQLTLGTWQQVVLIDCDTRPRSRKLIVQIVS